MIEQLMTLAQIGEILHRKPRAIKQLLVENPSIRPLRVGRSLLLTPNDFEKLLDGLREPERRSAPAVRRQPLRVSPRPVSNARAVIEAMTPAPKVKK